MKVKTQRQAVEEILCERIDELEKQIAFLKAVCWKVSCSDLKEMSHVE